MHITEKLLHSVSSDFWLDFTVALERPHISGYVISFAGELGATAGFVTALVGYTIRVLDVGGLVVGSIESEDLAHWHQSLVDDEERAFAVDYLQKQEPRMWSAFLGTTAHFKEENNWSDEQAFRVVATYGVCLAAITANIHPPPGQATTPRTLH